LAGKSKSILRILTVVSIAATLCVYAVMGVSGYTLAASLAESLMGLMGAPGEELLEMTIDPAGGVTLTLTFTGKNSGLMEVSATSNLELLSVDGEVIAEGSDSKRIPPGSSGELVVSLYVSPEDAAMFETSPPVIRLRFECRTLLDLVGLAISLEIGEEAPPLGP